VPHGGEPFTPSRPLTSPPDRLGFAVKVLGKPGIKDHDARRWQNDPHLRVSVAYLHGVFDWLAEAGIRMYRMSSDVAPYVTHPDLPQFHRQIEEAADDLATLGARARALDLRLSFHPSQYIVLNSPDELIADASIRDFVAQTALLDALGACPEAKVVTHVGGVYGERAAAIDRWVRRYDALPAAVRRRLVLENDEISYPVVDTIAIHERTGVPLVFDILHHRVNDPSGMPAADACRRCLATWPPGQTPKVHYSSQRTAMREVPRRNRTTHVRTATTQAARPGQHDDWIDPDDFITFLAATAPERFDIMLEAKQKDLAVLRLRDAIAAAVLAHRIW